MASPDNQTKFLEAQKHEEAWWGNCANTFGEEQKQLVYAKYMYLTFEERNGIPYQIDLQGKSVIDIGGGPVSLLLKTFNARERMVIDPARYPTWTKMRYFDARIVYLAQPAETELQFKPHFDEVWLYNVLQHVIDPEKVIQNARQWGKLIRVFEWIDQPTNEMHPHLLTEKKLNKWLGGTGNVEAIHEAGCVGTAYSGVFPV